MMKALDFEVGRQDFRCFWAELGPYIIFCNWVGCHSPERGSVVASVIVLLFLGSRWLRTWFVRVKTRGLCVAVLVKFMAGSCLH